ncbi:YbbR-like domain-containing protein [Caminicella sporogenes]|uniref:CdaR family protein n=1 Tax=Caminicella sporogenes TaxID=166485 RepID=UPI00254082AE|nr:CdaR family protein [Caminicella sporogenes]WIF95489.1 CdaR family protein [Caminicella sporogenes]
MISFLRGLLEKSKITRNTTPKVVAILFALVLWIYVMGEVNPEDIKILNNVKVQLLNVEELKNSGMVIVDQKDFTVDIKISGRRSDIYNISIEDIKVTADLRGYRQGVNSIPLEISSPANVTIEEIKPKQIKVKLDKIVKRQKIVKILKKGKPITGFEVGDVTVTPREVFVEGPETKVNAVARVIGEVNIDSVNEDIKTKVPVKAVDSEGNEVAGVEVSTKYVNVSAPIFKVRSVVIKPQIIGKVKEGYKITKIDVKPLVVELKGREDDVKAYTQVFTEPINVGGLSSTLTTTANLILSKNITASNLQEMPKVTIVVEKIESKEFVFNTNEISINNLKDGLTTNIGELKENIKVKINDARSILENIKRNDLELVINAEGLEEGVHVIPIKLNTKEKFVGVEIIPNEIEIEIYNKDTKRLEEMVNTTM